MYIIPCMRKHAVFMGIHFCMGPEYLTYVGGRVFICARELRNSHEKKLSPLENQGVKESNTGGEKN